jgi:hypothetical protein
MAGFVRQTQVDAWHEGKQRSNIGPPRGEGVHSIAAGLSFCQKCFGVCKTWISIVSQNSPKIRQPATKVLQLADEKVRQNQITW